MSNKKQKTSQRRVSSVQTPRKIRTPLLVVFICVMVSAAGLLTSVYLRVRTQNEEKQRFEDAAAVLTDVKNGLRQGAPLLKNLPDVNKSCRIVRYESGSGVECSIDLSTGSKDITNEQFSDIEAAVRPILLADKRISIDKYPATTQNLEHNGWSNSFDFRIKNNPLVCSKTFEISDSKDSSTGRSAILEIKCISDASSYFYTTSGS